MMRRTLLFILMTVLLVAAFVADMLTGSVSVALGDILAALGGAETDAVSRHIILNIRLTKAASAMFAGAALSVSGLMMQTLFRNPLAGPYVLGISSGASLGVALVVLAGAGGAMSVAGAAWTGAAAVLLLLAIVARRVRNITVILILGIMFSSGVSAVVQILQYLSDEQSLKTFVIWTMGSLADVTPTRLAILAPSVLVGLVLAMACVKPLNLLLFGEDYARTVGARLGRCRTMVFISTTLLAGTVTAFCGPVGFVGLAMPHVCRALSGSSDHRVLMPLCIMAGAAVMLLCDLLSKVYALPVNAITSVLGVPVVVWVVLRYQSFKS